MSKIGIYSIKRDKIPQATPVDTQRLRRKFFLKTNAIQIQTNSPRAAETVYQEICPSLLGQVKFVFLYPCAFLAKAKDNPQ